MICNRFFAVCFLWSFFCSLSYSVDLGKKKGLTRAVLLENAAEIDTLVNEQLSALQVERPVIASEEVFLRRAYLTIIGRIPTPEESSLYSELNTLDKRQNLIFNLYEESGYVSHLTNWAMDLLRLKDQNHKGYNAEALTHWVRDSLASNMPWNQLAKELVSTKGNAWVNKGAAGYYAMDLGMQNDNLANTAFSFLGVKMECAQCHDDPFREWERMDFYQLSALINGPTSINFGPNENLRRLASENSKAYNVEGFGRLDNLEKEIRYYINFGVSDKKGSGLVKLPSDWQYTDAEAGEMIAAKTPFGKKYKSEVHDLSEIKPDFSQAQGLKDRKAKRAAMQQAKKMFKDKMRAAKHGPGNGLEVFGEWLTSDDTPQFAQTIALRMWERVMGVSLTETLGVYQDAEETNFPALITYLSDLIREYDYDLKAFQSTLTLTNAFQAKTSSKYYSNGDPLTLSGRRVNRMSAAQIWDSLLSLVVADPDLLPKRTLPTRILYKGYDLGPIKESVKELSAMNRKDYTTRIKQMYEDLVAGKYPKVGRQREGTSPMSMMNMEKAQFKSKKGPKAIMKQLRRASELPSPIPKEHFLATFGQSDRMSVDGDSKEGAVSQALLMYNGAVQRYIVNNRSSNLRLRIKEAKTPTERVRTIFLSTLSREPSALELDTCLSEVQKAGNRAYFDILSALISSQEFLFIT